MTDEELDMRLTEANRNYLRNVIHMRDDFQRMRIANDNRLGKKADGKPTKWETQQPRALHKRDIPVLAKFAKFAREMEENLKKLLPEALSRFPIWNEWLSKIEPVQEVASAWLLSELDVRIADTASKFWQVCGFNPGTVRARKSEKDDKGKRIIVVTNTLVRGDRLTKGFLSPFNTTLRKVMMGIWAQGMINGTKPKGAKKGAKNIPSQYKLDYYDPYKHRLENSEREVQERLKNGKYKTVMWKDAAPGHRHMAAKRYMCKMFLRDLYVQWRTIEGLPVREPYAEEYLGKKHAVA